MKKLYFLLSLFAAITSTAQDADELDLTFAGTGWRSVTFTQPYFIDPKKFVFQEDGKVIFGAERLLPDEGSEAVIIRYNADGTLDGTYGTDGIILSKAFSNVGLNTQSEDFVLQADGKLLVAGSSFNAQTRIIRFTESGQLDPLFGNGTGYVDFPYAEYGEVFEIKLQSDQKIIVSTRNIAAGSNFKVWRLNTDGTLDSSFGTNGEFAASLPEDGQTENSYSLLITPDDKIIFSYREFVEPDTFRFHVRRITSNGENDNSFADNGIFSFDLDYINNTFYYIPFRADYLGRIYFMIPVYDQVSSQYNLN